MDKQRQDDYLDALGMRGKLRIHHGHYLIKTRHCQSCGANWTDYEEKMTDVNISVQLIADAFDDRFDTALIVSADNELTTPVRFVRERFPGKCTIVAQPPADRDQIAPEGRRRAKRTPCEETSWNNDERGGRIQSMWKPA